jgi:hypothetical protein
MSLRSKANLSFLANPFFIYCLAFLLAILTYTWGWSDLYPKLSLTLILFLIFSFVPFGIAGYIFERKKMSGSSDKKISASLIDIVFYLIITLGILDVLLTGYIPVLDMSHNYREFGAPVIDVLFNTLSIFFSIVFLQAFLLDKKRRFLIYLIAILIIQIILFRRSALVWIITSSLFCLFLLYRRIPLSFIIITILLIPLVASAFGFMGIKRSKLTNTQIVNELGASQVFLNSGLSHNFYLAYLYISSPLANLQKNISTKDKFLNKDGLEDFFFYCILPQSFTSRLERPLGLDPPVYNLITPQLIVGSCFMLSYCTLGWSGMILMLLFIAVSIILSLLIAHKWDTFFFPAVAVLSTAVMILIFDNILIRLDVLLMLFCYPALFHFFNSYLLKKNVRSLAEK